MTVLDSSAYMRVKGEVCAAGPIEASGLGSFTPLQLCTTILFLLRGELRGMICIQRWKVPPKDLVANRPWNTTRGRGIPQVDDSVILSDDMMFGITGVCFSVWEKRKLDDDV